MNNQHPFVFQCDSNIVKRIYNERDNYLIEYDDNCATKEYCTIYFSSNNIYFPNTESTFEKRIVKKNSYEWYGLRTPQSHKHIFVRDIQKQWYIEGINKQINTPEKLLDWLKQEAKGYKIICLGSSAGGYAAVLYGSLLNADRVLTFNGQFEINGLLSSTTEDENPLLFRNKDTSTARYFDIKPYINPHISIFYFTSLHSPWDKTQCKHIADVNSIIRIGFKTSHHGVPFFKCCLSTIVNSDKRKLIKMSLNSHHPFCFSIKLIGVFLTIKGIYKQFFDKIKEKL